jgi:hypothetical protein
MCRCAATTSDVINMINKKRERAGLDSVCYQSFMNRYRVIRSFVPPDANIGPSYTFNSSTAKRIVTMLWDMRYRKTPRVDWEKYRVA